MNEVCLLGPTCGLCFTRRPPRPLMSWELDRRFGVATNYEILPKIAGEG